MVQTTWKHRGGRIEIIQYLDIEGQARVPNGVKDIVSKISICFFHIYIYIGLIILFNYAKRGMPVFPFILSRGLSPEVEPTLLFIKIKKKKKKGRGKTGHVFGGLGKSI